MALFIESKVLRNINKYFIINRLLLICEKRPIRPICPIYRFRTGSNQDVV